MYSVSNVSAETHVQVTRPSRGPLLAWQQRAKETPANTSPTRHPHRHPRGSGPPPRHPHPTPCGGRQALAARLRGAQSTRSDVEPPSPPWRRGWVKSLVLPVEPEKASVCLKTINHLTRRSGAEESERSGVKSHRPDQSERDTLHGSVQAPGRGLPGMWLRSDRVTWRDTSPA